MKQSFLRLAEDSCFPYPIRCLHLSCPPPSPNPMDNPMPSLSHMLTCSTYSTEGVHLSPQRDVSNNKGWSTLSRWHTCILCEIIKYFPFKM
ncbi:hypothetical protein CDAR_68691 [Caerostris darwini]|uniref:Uncharacterized protein n=1 Tax=Caerostris darwini TaxID=1538125 RepID=A0AAV4WZB3_9ARAC|nr:hypothetical protein CDAR_68691 [Caerostris darwini]